ncbi:Sel1-like repeat [Trinorchestia longiramus]|nr:Sel1-like repeat [Trinorchestia longiramus]
MSSVLGEENTEKESSTKKSSNNEAPSYAKDIENEEAVPKGFVVKQGIDGSLQVEEVKDDEEVLELPLKSIGKKLSEFFKSKESAYAKILNELETDEQKESPLHDKSMEMKTAKKFKYENEEGTGASYYEKAQNHLAQIPSDEGPAFQLLSEAAERGHWKAKRQVAWGHVFGKHLPIDLVEARNLFTELAEKGDPEGQMGLGLMYAAGLSHNSSQAKALVYFTFGALGGNEWAQMALAYRYWAGIGVPSNCETALTYYRKVATTVSEQVSVTGGRAVQRVRLMEEIDNPNSGGMLDDDLIQYYQFLAEKGDVQAQIGLGQLHYQGGRGVQQDHHRALNYFMQAADAGNPDAMAFIGKMYLEGGHVVAANNETAYNYFKRAADLNNAVGYSGLGLMYLHGRHVKQDYKEALTYFSLAAKRGWVDGQLQLGNMYFSGLGVKRDYKKAIEYYNLASQSGHVLAFYSLAQMQSTGTGMLRSCHTSVELFKNVAERGSWGELLTSAHQAYWAGQHKRALLLYMLLAELGYEVAQSNAAYILARHGPFPTLFPEEETLSRALMYWGRAAGQGYSFARVKLGDHYYYGWGTNVDYEAAAAHYRLASEQQRNAQAMFNLGYMHEQGEGLNQDIYLAKRFYDLARDSDSDAAVPVALALAKLAVLFAIKFITEFDWRERLSKLDPDFVFGPDWDIYMMILLTVLIASLVVLRQARNLPLHIRQQQQQNNNNNNNNFQQPQ